MLNTRVAPSYVVALVLACCALPRLSAEVASSWNVVISPSTNSSQSLLAWTFLGRITNEGGVRWTNGFSSFGSFHVISPITDLTGFYSGPNVGASVAGFGGGLSNVTGGYQYDFSGFDIRSDRLVLNIFPTMTLSGQPYIRTPVQSGQVVVNTPFAYFGQGTYISPTNTFYSGIDGGFISIVDVVPEPSTYALLLMGSGAVWLWKRRRA